MLSNAPLLADLSDRDLVATVARLAARERDATAELVAALAELDARKLYLDDGCASLFTYCTQRLRLSESAAYHRITAARAVWRFPVILERLREGALTLTAVGLLAAHLTDANHLAVLDAARDMGKRAVEELVARLQPRPDVASSIRKLPGPRATAGDRSAGGRLATLPDCSANGPLVCAALSGVGERPVASPSLPCAAEALALEAITQPNPRRPALVRPLAPSRYQVQVTVSAETHAKLRRAQDLLRHAIPDGDPAAVLDRALTVLLEQLERTKCAAKASTPHVRPHDTTPRRRTRIATADPPPAMATRRTPDTQNATTSRASLSSCTPGSRPHGRSRTIPAAVRRVVWARDRGRCSYVGTSGRCLERSFLEYHHRLPFAAGGESTIENVALLCRAHNSHLAERDFPADAEAFAVCAYPATCSMPGPPTASGGS